MTAAFRIISLLYCLLLMALMSALRNGATTYTYNDADQVHTVAYAYDYAGRMTNMTTFCRAQTITLS